MSTDTTLCRYCNYLSDCEYICDPTNPDACQPCRELSDLEVKVKELRMMLVGLESRRRKLKMQANQHHDRLIHRLPPEIVGEIFESCIPECLFDLGFSVKPRSTFSTPLVISAVCVKWRDLAYATPRLWNTLPFYSKSQHRNSLPQLSIVHEWIDRAGQLPLSIILQVSSSVSVIMLIKMLNQYSNRWKHLRFEGSSSLVSFLPSQIHPELRTLHIKIEGVARKSPLKLCLENLDSLSVSGMKLKTLDFDWQHLTQLELEDITSSEFLTALRKAPDLIKFVAEISYEVAEDNIEFPLPITHSRLQELKIGLFTEVNPLKNMMCPCLKTLTLVSNGEGNGSDDEDTEVDNPAATIFAPFLKTSQCPLERLSLENGFYLSETDTISIFTIPTLKYLSLSLYESISDRVLDVFFGYLTDFSTLDGKDVPCHLPALHSLDLELEQFSCWTMLPNIFGYPPTYPWPGNCRPDLKVVAIWLRRYAMTMSGRDVVEGSDFDEETLARILSLKEAGVKWQLHFGMFNQDLIELAVDFHDE